MTTQPVRPFGGTPAQGIAQIKAAGITTSGVTQGTPKNLANISIQRKNLNSTQAQLTVSFQENPGDPYYSSAKVYLRLGSGQPTVIGEGAHSPLVVTVTRTSTPAAIQVQATGNWGSVPLDSCPSAGVNLK